MTVKELCDQLRQYPDDAQVFLKGVSLSRLDGRPRGDKVYGTLYREDKRGAPYVELRIRRLDGNPNQW